MGAYPQKNHLNVQSDFPSQPALGVSENPQVLCSSNPSALVPSRLPLLQPLGLALLQGVQGGLPSDAELGLRHFWGRSLMVGRSIEVYLTIWFMVSNYNYNYLVLL